jgi:hypothetical protein
MSNRDIERLKNELLTNKIELSDTISQFMEKCNNNFSAIIEWGGGPAGEKGETGEPGIPAKPKVPIHVWREGIEYGGEQSSSDGGYEFITYYEDLNASKYQEGHLIMLENAHVYILEVVDFNLKPKFILALKTYDPGDVIDGRNAYVHFAYTNDIESFDDFIKRISFVFAKTKSYFDFLNPNNFIIDFKNKKINIVDVSPKNEAFLRDYGTMVNALCDREFLSWASEDAWISSDKYIKAIVDKCCKASNKYAHSFSSKK